MDDLLDPYVPAFPPHFPQTLGFPRNKSFRNAMKGHVPEAVRVIPVYGVRCPEHLTREPRNKWSIRCKVAVDVDMTATGPFIAIKSRILARLYLTIRHGIQQV